jgi:hypothetical protein
MNAPFFRKFIFIIIGFTILAVLFYWFMTANRSSLHLAKEFESELNTIISDTDLRIYESNPIPPEEVKLPMLNSIRLFFQRNLYRFNLMHLGKEQAGQYKIKSLQGDASIICKGRFAGDYLIGIVVECEKLKTADLTFLKNKFKKVFHKYDILWIEK